MGVTIEVGYFNTFALKRLASTAIPQVADLPEDWFVEESRIKGGYNNTTVDFGVKAYLVEEQAESARRGNSLIYSGIYNSRTGINQTNQFSVSQDITRSVDPVGGTIQKLFAEDTNLIIFQEKKVNGALIDKDAIFTAEGSAITTSGRLVIGQITPYQGNWGIGTNPESFAAYGFRKYFVDRNRNAVLRLSRDGITEISNYGMTDFFRDQLGAITSTGLITGGYDIHNQNYIVSMKPTFTSSYKTLAFDERSQGWTTFYTYNPSFITSLKGNTYNSFNGKWYQCYVDTQPRNSFHDLSASPSTVKFILNPAADKMKNFNTISYEGTNGWEVTSIVSDETGWTENNPAFVSDTASTIWSYDQGQYQEGGITQYAGFARKQNNYVAAIKNNTPAQTGEVVFGDSLMGIKGYNVVVTMQTDTTRPVTANSQTVQLTATDENGLKELFSVGSTFNIE
tara:strand:- start:2728 stop:4086 length:1359 start_codon:yes stop_codon:yes gene_type:complete